MLYLSAKIRQEFDSTNSLEEKKKILNRFERNKSENI